MRPPAHAKNRSPQMRAGILAAVGICSLRAAGASAEQAVSAAEVAGSVGVNVHLSFSDTWYTRHFDQVLASLAALHIRHVRDGVAAPGQDAENFNRHHQALAAAGIGADFITARGESESYLEGYRLHAGDLEFLEAPNEPDANGARDWAGWTRSYLRMLAAAARSPAYKGVPLIGPSLVNANWRQSGNSYAQLGPIGPLIQFGNLHNYPGGRNPGTAGWSTGGYGSIGYAIRTAHKAWPGVPLITTETGYRTDLPAEQAVPESVEARYLPRLVLEQFLHGIRRTYLYELADDQFSGGSFGLLHSDGTTKPAFKTLQALMNELSDSEPLRPGRAAFSLRADTGAVHRLLAEKHPGIWTLFVWLEVPSYDPDTRQALPVAPVPAAVHLGPGCSITGMERISTDGVKKMPVNAKSILVTDEVLEVRIEQH